VFQQEKIDTGPALGPRVLVWPSWWYPNRTAPLCGLFVRRQAAAIAAFCPTAVLFVTPDPALRTRREIVAVVEDGLLAVRVYFRPAAISPWRVISDSLRFMSAARAGRRALPKPFQDPDLVQVQITPPVSLILSLRFFWRRTAVVFSEHWSKYLLPPGRENPLRRWFIRGFAARCAAVTAVSETLAHGMRAHGLKASQWRIIGNVVDPETFCPRTVKISRNYFSILHVSFQSRIKNIAGVVRAMAKLAPRRPDIRLQVIGSGPVHEECRELARALGLIDRVVFFRDALAEKEIAEAMRQGDILVLFSEFETFACVAAEALASGLAVVSTPTAVMEYLPEGSGVLVPFGDEDALASALEKMVDRLPDFDGAPGRRAVSERFAPREIGLAFQRLFQDVRVGNKP
jgi:glycosyltransferase involved in cell wall biosynthesis